MPCVSGGSRVHLAEQFKFKLVHDARLVLGVMADIYVCMYVQCELMKDLIQPEPNLRYIVRG